MIGLIYIIGVCIALPLVLASCVSLRTSHEALLDAWTDHLQRDHSGSYPSLYKCDCVSMAKKKKLFEEIDALSSSDMAWIRLDKEWTSTKISIVIIAILWPIVTLYFISRYIFNMIGNWWKSYVRGRIHRL